MPEDEKKNISYAEIAFSFIGSFMVLVWCLVVILLLFVLLFAGETSLSYIERVLYLIGATSILLLTPFTSTVLRVGLDNKLSDQQEKIISGFTIIPALLSIYFTANFFNWPVRL
jgi:hypothetical protein